MSTGDRLRAVATTALGAGILAGEAAGRRASAAGHITARAWADPQVRRVMVVAGVEGVLLVVPRLVPATAPARPVARRVALGLAAAALARAEARRALKAAEGGAGAAAEQGGGPPKPR